MSTSFFVRTFRIAALSAIVISLSTIGITVAQQGPGGPGGGGGAGLICIEEATGNPCATIYNPTINDQCCDCDSLNSACPIVDPPGTDTTTIPTAPVKPCVTDDGTDGPCSLRKGIVGGSMQLMCNSPEVFSALTITSVQDAAFGGSSCAPEPPCGTCNKGCGTGQCGTNSIQLANPNISFVFSRYIVPSNQVELLSFGRGMASEYDLRFTIYPVTDSDPVGVLFDPQLKTTFYPEDTGSNGTYDLDHNIYYKSIKLTDASGNAESDVTKAFTETLYAEITRRNGWEYKLEVCPEPLATGAYMSRLVKITNPQGFTLDLTYKTWTQAELDASPSRQLQIDTITDGFGNTAQYTYNSTQQGGLWVVSEINVNTGEVDLDYSYDTNGLLASVSRNGETTSTYSYGTDSTYSMATLAMTDRQCKNHMGNKQTLLLSNDYQTGDETVVNQFLNILQGRRDGAGHVASMLYHDPSNVGWYKIAIDNRMVEVKLGESIRWYTTFTNSGGGYSGITGTLESSYARNPGITATQIKERQPPSYTNETGYAVSYTYDSDANLTRIDHPDGTSYEKMMYDSNNRPNYFRDREGYVRSIDRDSNNNITRIASGLTDPTGSGSPTATTEAVMDIMGYYTSGAHDKMLKWSAREAYASTITEPAANSRTDYAYGTNNRVSTVTLPLPNGQTSRPQRSVSWVGNQKTSEVTVLGHTVSYTYDDIGRLIRTLYADGTDEQTWYDDVNRYVYNKNRIDVVSRTGYGVGGRVANRTKYYGRDTDLTDGTISTVNSNDTDKAYSYYVYIQGSDRMQSSYDGTNVQSYSFDFRGRQTSVTQYVSNSYLTNYTQTDKTYVDNQLFMTQVIKGGPQVRTYMGYSADGLTVRTIQTRDPSVTFADNAAVLAATRSTGSNPTHVINDAIRDKRGNVVQLTGPNGVQTLSVFDSLGRSTSTTRSKNSLSLGTTTEYDADGSVTKSTAEDGVVTQMTYDDAGNLKTKTPGFGTTLAQTWTYTYTADSKQATVTDPLSAVTTTEYQTCCGFTVGSKNALGHGSVSNRDAAGRTVHTAVLEDYDTHANLLNPTDSKTLSESTTKYRDDGRVQYRTQWKSARGLIDRNNPPIAGVGSVATSEGLTTQYLYDDHIYDGDDLDNATGMAITRLGGGSANVSISAALTKLAQTPANGGAGVDLSSASLGRGGGRAKVVIAPDEKMMQVSIMDGTGRTVMSASMTGPAATTPNQLVNWNCTQYGQTDTTTFAYETAKTVSVNPDGNTTISLADGFGRSVGSLDQLGNLSKIEYDSAGNMTKSINALNQETTFAYDDLNRQTSITDPLSNVTETVYNATTGRVTSTKDAKGKSTTNTYDALGRVETVTDRLGQDTDRTYDAVGRLLTITDAENRTTTYGYNSLGQRTSVTLADSSSRAMTYDPAGRQLTMTAPSGNQMKTIYEFYGVVDKVEYYNGSSTLVGTDDFTYDTLLRKTGATSRYGVTQAMTYTDRGQLDTDTTTYDSQSYVVNYDYDDRGRVTKVTYPSGRAVDYAYDDRGQLKTVDWDGSTIETIGYDDLGRLTSVDRPFVDESRTYDAGGRLTAVNNTNVGDASYTYDANGNKQSESWTGVMAGWNFTTTNTGTYPSGYDDEDRFRNFVQSAKSVELFLDRSNIGNITNYKLGTTDAFRSYSNTHELTTIDGNSQTFDVDGQLTDSHTGIELDWDEAGMLSSTVVSSGDTAGIEGTNEYGYDASRKRAWKKITRSGSVAEHTVFIYAGPNCIAEYASGTAAASPNQEYVYGLGIDSLKMIVRSGGTQKLTVTRNQQWSISALADHSNGTVLERYTYDSFGKRTILAADGSTVRTVSSYDTPYGYTSRRHDEESGLMYFRARYYDTETGEFGSPDPMEYVDGMSLFRVYIGMVGVDPDGQQQRGQRHAPGYGGSLGGGNPRLNDLWWNHYWTGKSKIFKMHEYPKLSKRFLNHSDTKAALQRVYDSALAKAQDLRCPGSPQATYIVSYEAKVNYGDDMIFGLDGGDVGTGIGLFPELLRSVEDRDSDTSLYALGNTTLTITGKCQVTKTCTPIRTWGVVGWACGNRDISCFRCNLNIKVFDEFADPYDLFNWLKTDVELGYPYYIQGNYNVFKFGCD